MNGAGIRRRCKRATTRVTTIALFTITSCCICACRGRPCRVCRDGFRTVVKVNHFVRGASAGRVLFVGNAKPQVGSDCEPGKQECKRSRLACPKNSCYGQCGSAGLQGRDQGQGNGHNMSAVRHSCGAQLLTEASGLGTIPRDIGRRQ